MERIWNNKDLTSLVLNKLSVKDIYNISQTFDKDFIHQRAVLEIRRRLKMIFQDKFGYFLNLLQKTGAVISGSFVLQCILNTYWESDIDIYFPIQGNEIKETPSQNPASEIDDFLYQNKMQITGYYAANRYGSDVDLKIKWVRNYKKLDENDFYKSYKHFSHTDIIRPDKKNYTFQTILVDVNRDEMKNFIINSFDFDICKNIFDGNSVYIYNLKDIVEKKTQFKYSMRLESSALRCKKYKDRGFEIYGKDIPYSEIINSNSRRCRLKVRNLTSSDTIEGYMCGNDCFLNILHPNDQHYHISEGPGERIIIIPPEYFYK